MARTPNPIPNYALFGDDADLPDVVHVETIEARSRLHDWEFAPHRHGGLHQVLLMQDGAGTATLDGETRALAGGDLVNVPVGLVHGYRFAPGTRGRVVTLAAEILDEVLHPSEGLAPVLARPAVFPVPPDLADTIHRIEAAHLDRAFARAQILRSLSGLLLGQIAQSLLEQDRATGPVAPSPLIARFEALLDTHFRAHWRVADYAAALAVSPTHLSRLARDATGKPASALIAERLIREARRNLVYTNMRVATIAYDLGFDDPAYFSRVFTRATGHSPRAFRANLPGRAGSGRAPTSHAIS